MTDGKAESDTKSASGSSQENAARGSSGQSELGRTNASEDALPKCANYSVISGSIDSAAAEIVRWTTRTKPFRPAAKDKQACAGKPEQDAGLRLKFLKTVPLELSDTNSEMWAHVRLSGALAEPANALDKRVFCGASSCSPSRGYAGPGCPGVKKKQSCRSDSLRDGPSGGATDTSWRFVQFVWPRIRRVLEIPSRIRPPEIKKMYSDDGIACWMGR